MAKKKLLGALPVGFKGKFAGVPFSISVQYDIYGNVSAIVLSTENKAIISIDGDSKKIKDLTDKFFTYISTNTDQKLKTDQDFKYFQKDYYSKIKDFVKNITQEVNDYNKKQMPIKKAVKKVAKKVATKKAIIKKVVKKSAPKKAIKKTTIKPAIKKQTGTSNIAFDKRHQALPAGKRTSASGKVYYESRANRSDAGKLLGINTIKPNQATIDKYSKKSNLTIKRLDPKSQIIKDLSSVLNNISSLEKNIFNLGLMIKDLRNKNIKTSLKKDLSIYKSLLKERKIEYKEIKKLL